MSNVAYTTTPLDFLVSPVTFDAGGPSTLVGATVRVDARNTKSGVKVAGTATVVSATSMRCTFSAGSLAVGDWEVQPWVSTGGVTQVILLDPADALWHLKPGAF